MEEDGRLEEDKMMKGEEELEENGRLEREERMEVRKGWKKMEGRRVWRVGGWYRELLLVSDVSRGKHLRLAAT